MIETDFLRFMLAWPRLTAALTCLAWIYIVGALVVGGTAFVRSWAVWTSAKFGAWWPFILADIGTALFNAVTRD